MLSERVRPNVEAALWVVEEIKKLEQKLANYERKCEAGYSQKHYIDLLEEVNELRAQIAEVETQEPELWLCEATNEEDLNGEEATLVCFTEKQAIEYRELSDYTIRPLYAHPAPKHKQGNKNGTI